MARKHKKNSETGISILLIDDNLEYLEATATLIGREGHTVTACSNPEEGLDLCKKTFFDLILVDYYMPEMTGEEFVIKLRQFNTLVQVILQTGYSSEQPPREMLKRLDIQGYVDKSEGPDKLLLWVDVGLSSAKTTQFLYKSRESLKYILNVTPDLHKIQSLDELLKGILIQIMGLLGVVSSFLAVYENRKLPYHLDEKSDNNGFITMVQDEETFFVQAATGRFKERQTVNSLLNKEEYSFLVKTIQESHIAVDDNKTYVPLYVGNQVLGAIYMEQPIESEQDINLLSIFVNQAAVAIHNSQLYKFATIDPLTGVFMRGYVMQCFIRELRQAFRNKIDYSLLIVDLDDLKVINDNYGHIAGDKALKLMGSCLIDSTRQTDFIGRYGGDEFIVILPKSDKLGTEHVLKRIYSFIEKNRFTVDNKPIKISCSIGALVIPSPVEEEIAVSLPIPQYYYEKAADRFIKAADLALYASKTGGKGRYMFTEEPASWPREAYPED
ncbi:MAG: diguanylate cyclase [Spirochaetes bacterium]|nr:diguanylate cyclase [Spirochaetota bacterium]